MTTTPTPFQPAVERRFAAMPFGGLACLSGPQACGAAQLAIMEVRMRSGAGHSFHYHADQEEMLYVVSGRVEQWFGRDRRVLAAGDAIVIPAGAVHASFNPFAETAVFLAVLGPCVGETGYACVDVFDRAPWNELRPIATAAS